MSENRPLTPAVTILAVTQRCHYHAVLIDRILYAELTGISGYKHTYLHLDLSSFFLRISPRFVF